MSFKNSYFELVNRLNQSNKVKNQITEPQFFIIENRLYLGLSLSQKLVICSRLNRCWYASQITGFDLFEQKIARLMNNSGNDQNNLDIQIKKLLFK